MLSTKSALKSIHQAIATSGFAHQDGGRKFVIITSCLSLFWIAIMLTAGNSRFVHQAETRSSQRILFNIREILGKTPPLSPHIKLLDIDDRTVSYLGTANLSNLEWAQSLANISARNPKAIVVDKLFWEEPADNEETRKAYALFKTIKTPIYSGATILPGRLYGHDEFDLSLPNYNIQRLAPPSSHALDNILVKNNQHVYGHAHWFHGIISGVGHINYDDNEAVIPPLLSISGKYVIPYLGLAPFIGGMRIDGDTFIVNDHEMPLNEEGMSFFNHRPPKYLESISKSMRNVIPRGREGYPEKNVDEGDIVLIGTHYTGGTDFHEVTPFGTIPGDYLLACMLDSGLTGRWLRDFGHYNLVTILLCMLGILTGRLARPVAFWSATLLVMSLVFCLAVYLFCYQGIFFPWIMPLTGFFVAGMILFANQSIQNELKKIAFMRDFYQEKAGRLEEENKKIQLEESLALGKAVQELLLPQQYHGKFSQYEYHMKYTPSQIMSGDWLYVWNANADEQRIFIGDVMGKGPSAAIPVAIIIGMLNECQLRGLDMHDAIVKLNQQMVDLFRSRITSTCAAIVLRTNHAIDIYNAGSPGWVFTKEGNNTFHPLRSNPLGASQDCNYAKISLEACGRCALFTFTDGYLEGGRALRRLIKTLDQTFPFLDGGDAIHDILMTCGEGSRQEDDRTFLSIMAPS